MQNWWKVIFREPGSKAKALRANDVHEAVGKAKELKAKGFSVDVVSGIKGFAPTLKAGPRPSPKHYWCPYCVKWRVFIYAAVRMNGFRGPEDMRCPVCLISDHDYNVRRFNGLLGEADLEMVYRLENAFQRG